MKLNPHQTHILAAVDSASDTILSVSHQIHAHPELGMSEVFASDLLVETLERFDFNVERGFAGIPTAFCARKGQRKGPRIAFLAEYDALPGIGHACGHNVIAASALGAGIGLGAVIDELDGEVWVVGTPAEESEGGKVLMVQRGVFQNVDAALMVHPYGTNYKYSEGMALDAVQVEFHGKPAHAAGAPWEGKNALDAMILTFSSVNALRQQMRPDGRIHGIITHGGDAPNIIPEYTCARFFLRANTRSYLTTLAEQFKACAQAAALATGTRLKIANYQASLDDIVTNTTMASRMHDYLVGALGSGPFEENAVSIGSTDLGNVSHVVPAFHTLLDISSGNKIAPHTPDFCVAAASPTADTVTLRAGKGLALTGYDLLASPEFLQQAKDEFTRAVK